MTRTGKRRLSRPLYEGLPWIYVAGGALALAGSYFCPYRALSLAIGLLGLLALLGGIVVLLSPPGPPLGDIEQRMLADHNNVTVVQIVTPHALGLHVDAVGAVQILNHARMH